MKKEKKSLIGLTWMILLLCVIAVGCGKKESKEDATPSNAVEINGTYYSESEDATYEFEDGVVKVTASNGVSVEGTYDVENNLMTIILGDNILTYNFKQTDTGFELSGQSTTYVYIKQEE